MVGETRDATAGEFTAERLSELGLRFEVDGSFGSPGRVATVTLARPERRNAMTPGMWHGLASIGENLPPEVRVVVVRGAGTSFSSGIDLRAFGPDGIPGEPPLITSDSSDSAVVESIETAQRGFTWLRRPDIVSIAAVHGHAIGAGFQLALACDLRVLASGARLCMKEASLGLVPDLTGTKPLVELVGVARAVELCLTARTVTADEARQLGLATVVVDESELDAAVADLCAALLEVPRDAAAATKELLYAAPDRTLDEQRSAEARAQLHRLRATLDR